MKNFAVVSYRYVAAVLFLALGVAATALGQSPFTAGNIVVVQMGNGSGALSSAAAPISLIEYTPSGTLVQTIPFASTGSSPRLVVTGSSGSEGHVVRSSDGNYLTVVGYDTVAGAASFALAAVRREVARIDASGTINYTTEFTDGSTTAVRSAVTDNGSNTWTATSSIGVRYKSFGSTGTSTQLSSAPTNTRVVKIFNGQLYITSASGAYLAVASIGSGTPTTSGQTTTALPGMPATGTHSPYSFSISPDGNTLYIADDGAASAGGGIQKWTFSGSTWSLAYTLLNNGSTTTSTRGLAVDWSGANPVIYATTTATSANNLIKVVDTGSGSTATTIATAPTFTVYRGVDFTPASAVAPTVTTNPATSILATGATLNGSVNPGGASTTVSFDYGTTALYGTNVSGTPSPITGGTNTAVSAAITSLTPNQLYHFRVDATNSVATANGSDATFTTLPTAPTATPASSVGETGFTANWTASGDVNAPSSYTLEVATSSGFGGTIIQTDPGLTGTNFVVTTSISGGNTYYYRVTAVGTGGSSAPSNTISQLTLPPAPVATAPSNVIATAFDANWNASTSATSYRLDVATDIGFSSFVSGYNNLTVNATTQTVSGISPTIKYYYRARAVNATGTSANGTIDSATTIAAAPPTLNTPTAASIGATGATLGANVFSDNNDADFQRGIVWATTVNPDTNSTRVIASGTGTGVFTTPVTGLTPGTLIHYRGYAINHFGIGYTSDATFYSLSVEPATQATGFAAAAPFAATVGLSWTASADGNGYLILQKTGSDPADVPSAARRYSVGDSIGTSRVVAFITSNATMSTSDTGLAGSTNYHFAIMTFAWDGTNSGTINYNTSSIPTSNTTTLSNLSDVVATPGFVYASGIPYVTYTGIGDITKLNSVAAFGLTVRDGGPGPDADAAGTTLTSISFSVTNWSFLSRAALYLGDTTELGEVAVSSGTVAFGGLTGVVAPDGGTATLVLRVVYNTTVADNARNTYTVSSAIADSSGSVFAAANGGGAVSSTSGTDNVVSVVATQLIFSPNVVGGKYNVAFSATAKAVDINNNVDSDYVSPQVAFTKASGPGNLTGNSPVTPVKGIATEATLVLDQGGTYTLQASSGSLSGISNSFAIAAPATFKVNAGADTLYWDQPSTWVVVRGGSVTGIPHKADSVIFDHQFHTGKYVVCPARNATDTSTSAPTDTVGQLTIGYPGNPDTVELYIPPGGYKNNNAAVLWGDSVAGNYDLVIAERGVVRDSKWSYSKSMSYKSVLDSVWIRSGGLWYHNTTGYPTMLARMSHRLDGDYGTVEFDVDSRQGSFDINAPGYYYPNVVFSNRTGYAPTYYLYFDRLERRTIHQG